MMDKGYYIDFPKEFKWDPIKTKDGQFVNRLNNANIGLLTNDLEMLCQPARGSARRQSS